MTDIPLRLGPRTAGAEYRAPERPSAPPETPSGPRAVIAEAFVIGLMVGGPRESSALAITERSAETPLRHVLRYLERWPAGAPFPDIADRVLAVTRWKPLIRHEEYHVRLGLGMIVADRDGLGRLTVQLLTRAEPTLPVLTLETGGERTVQDPEGWRVPEADLVENFHNLQRADRLDLGFPEDVEHQAELTAQITALGVDALPSGRDRYRPEAGQGDDLLRALLLACWWGEVASPGRIAHLPDPLFHCWSKEALRIQEEEGRRIKPYLPLRDKFMIEGV